MNVLRKQGVGACGGGEKKEEERGKKEKKSAACLLGALFAIPFPMHLVCVCAERERGSKRGTAVWGRLITSDL